MSIPRRMRFEVLRRDDELAARSAFRAEVDPVLLSVVAKYHPTPLPGLLLPFKERA